MRSNLFAFVALLLAGVVVRGQTFDTAILGTVVDASQAAIPNAEVIIEQTATGVSRTVKTNSEGIFEFRYIVPGEYTVQVKAERLSCGETYRHWHSNRAAGQNHFRAAGGIGTTDTGSAIHFTAPADRRRDIGRRGQFGPHYNLP